MTRVLVIGLLMTLLAACAGMQPFRSSGTAEETAYERQILLTLSQKQFSTVALAGAPGRRYLLRRGYGATPEVERTLNQLAKEHGIERVDGWPIGSLGVYCEVYEVPENLGVEEIVERLMDDPRVDLVQRMNIFDTLIGRYDDPYADLQSAMPQLGVAEAHQLATGRGVLIAVIDSAVDAMHPELRGRIGIKHNLVNTHDGRPGGEIHGTAIAGIIASTANNREGIIGVAPDVDIAALRACWSVAESGSAAQCSSFSLARALEVALSIEPAVINLSLAGPFDPLLSRLLDEAIARGIIVVAAEPESQQQANFPASHPRVIVAHSTFARRDERSPYLLAAPATEILTTIPNAGYGFFSGNSLAAAHITGVIALLMERDPSMEVDRIAALLAETMTDSPDVVSISACRALERLTAIAICGRTAEVVSF